MNTLKIVCFLLTGADHRGEINGHYENGLRECRASNNNNCSIYEALNLMFIILSTHSH